MTDVLLTDTVMEKNSRNKTVDAREVPWLNAWEQLNKFVRSHADTVRIERKDGLTIEARAEDDETTEYCTVEFPTILCAQGFFEVFEERFAGS